MIQERLAALREEMKKRNIAIYVVPTADFHESEYVGSYFKARKFITGFDILIQAPIIALLYSIPAVLRPVATMHSESLP